jgi:hypothetical protein
MRAAMAVIQFFAKSARQGSRDNKLEAGKLEVTSKRGVRVHHVHRPKKSCRRKAKRR